MDIREKIIKNYPLDKKIDCALDCYMLAKKRYLIFWNGLVSKNSMGQILMDLGNMTDNSVFSEWKTLIVVGKTTDVFKKKELSYFNGVNTFVVFYLIDEEKDRTYMDDSWIFALGLNYKKYVKRINEILKNE